MFALIILAAISLAATFFLTLIYKKFTNQEKLKEAREKQKELQKKIRETRDREKILELQKEIMTRSIEQIKESMKSMLITFVPVLLLILWLNTFYKNIKLPLFGWIWWYIIFSIIFSILLRKAMKVY